MPKNELHLKLYSDPSHGWLAVKTEIVRLAGCEISPFSYQRGKTAYLEEDSDAPAFLRAIKEKGFSVFIEERHTNRNSPIRSYKEFRQLKEQMFSEFIRDHFVFATIGFKTPAN